MLARSYSRVIFLVLRGAGRDRTQFLFLRAIRARPAWRRAALACSAQGTVLSPTAFVKKLQEQNEGHQASTAKMAEGMALALEKKDQVNGRTALRSVADQSAVSGPVLPPQVRPKGPLSETPWSSEAPVTSALR